MASAESEPQRGYGGFPSASPVVEDQEPKPPEADDMFALLDYISNFFSYLFLIFIYF